jgi:hypothetical protein
LVAQRVAIEARGFINELGIERSPLCLDCFPVREAKLGPLRQPGTTKRGHSANRGTREGGKSGEVARVHGASPAYLCEEASMAHSLVQSHDQRRHQHLPLQRKPRAI